jgi:hypothetical protein
VNALRILRGLALAALATGLAACGRCSSTPAGGASSASPGSSGEAAPGASAAAGDDVPEIRDTGRGLATAGLRALLTAHGIAFDAAALERECKVDDEGASIDDLEEVAQKYGLDATQIVLPPEHVTLPEAKMLPGLVIVEAPDESLQFFVAWKLDGDRVQVLDPAEGRKWMPRADLEKMLHVHEVTLAADDWKAATDASEFRDALRARITALGVDRGGADALVARADAEPGGRGLMALDAAIRELAATPPASGEARAKLEGAYVCNATKRCEGDATPTPPELWTALPAKGGKVVVSVAVMVTVTGRRAAEPEPAATP